MHTWCNSTTSSQSLCIDSVRSTQDGTACWRAAPHPWATTFTGKDCCHTSAACSPTPSADGSRLLLLICRRSKLIMLLAIHRISNACGLKAGSGSHLKVMARVGQSCEPRPHLRALVKALAQQEELATSPRAGLLGGP